MSVVLSLKRVVEELDLVHDGVTVYLDTRTGEFEALGMEEMLAAESEAAWSIIRNGSESRYSRPGRFSNPMPLSR